MAKVIADMTMSLDGFIADPKDGVDELFGWFSNGDVSTPIPSGTYAFQTSEASAGVLRDALAGAGALITGRRNFDLTQGWGGHHPVGVPTIVLTHSVPDGWPREDSSMIFVTSGLEDAVAQAKEIAGDKAVVVATPDVTQQLINARLLDELSVNVVPVLLGDGIPFFANLIKAPVRLSDPTVVEGNRVTHLRYRVTYS
jgi:dihydrofolate reductase